MKRPRSSNERLGGALFAVLLSIVCALLPALTSAQTPELDALERRAEERFAEDDLETAAELYRQLAAQRPEDAGRARALLTAAWIDHLAGSSASARETLIQALVTWPELEFRPELYDPPFAELYAAARERALDERERLATAAVRRGAQHLRDGEWSGARAQLEEALQLRPDYPQAIYNLALVDLYEERLDEAAAGFSRLRELAQAGAAVPSELLAQALTNLGFVESRRGRAAAAEEALAEAVELMPENEPAWTNLGLARRTLGRPAAAVAEAFRAAHELAPEDPGTTANLALALLDLEDWRAASELLEDAAVKNGDDPALWLHLGRARQGLGDAVGAAEAFTAAMRHDPDDAGGWAGSAAVHLANQALERGDTARLRELAERLVAWRPRSSDGYVYRGLADYRDGDLEAARAALEEARRLEPGQANILGHLGNVYLDSRLFDLATQAFESALAIDPASTAARDGLKSVAEHRRLAAEGRSTLPGASRPRPAPPPPPAPPSPPAAPSTPPPADAGLTFADVDYAALGLRGVLVESVAAGSPAARAGIENGDLIFEAGGREINNAADFEAAVEAAVEAAETRISGNVLEIRLLRANMPRRVELQLAESASS